MPRLRSSAQQGTITDNPLTSGATTINSANFAALPVIASPDTLTLVLDPYETVGDAEIVTVTAHTASASSVTVTRGQESTTARQHAQGMRWVHSPTALDFLPEHSTDVTSSGPPTTGTWLQGQEYLDGQGVYWTCVLGGVGTAAVWQCASPGAAIDDVFSDANITSTQTTLATGLEVGLTITPTGTGVNEVEITCQAVLALSATGTTGNLSVCDVTGNATPATTNEILRLTANPNVLSLQEITLARRVTLPASTRTIKAFLWIAANEVRLNTNLVGAAQPARLMAAWA